jgi:hypothetical protein
LLNKEANVLLFKLRKNITEKTLKVAVHLKRKRVHEDRTGAETAGDGDLREGPLYQRRHLHQAVRHHGRSGRGHLSTGIFPKMKKNINNSNKKNKER